MSVKIKATVDYRDLELGKIVRKDEELEVSESRAELLISKKFAKPVAPKPAVVKQKEEKLKIKTKELKKIVTEE